MNFINSFQKILRITATDNNGKLSYINKRRNTLLHYSCLLRTCIAGIAFKFMKRIHCASAINFIISWKVNRKWISTFECETTRSLVACSVACMNLIIFIPKSHAVGAIAFMGISWSNRTSSHIQCMWAMPCHAMPWKLCFATEVYGLIQIYHCKSFFSVLLVNTQAEQKLWLWRRDVHDHTGTNKLWLQHQPSNPHRKINEVETEQSKENKSIKMQLCFH